MILDIETIPAEEYLNNPPDWFKQSKFFPHPKLGNLVDPKKIEARTSEWEEKGGTIKELSIISFTAVPICIGTENKEIITINNNILEELFADIQHNLPLITFNGKGFDLRILSAFCAVNGWSDLSRAFASLITSKYDFSTHLDLMDYAEIVLGMPYISLDELGHFLSIPFEKQGSGADIWNWYQNNEMQKIIEHCKADIELTRLCAEKLGFRR